MANLAPHPLVTEIADGLAGLGVPLSTAGNRMVRTGIAAPLAAQPPAAARGQLTPVTQPQTRMIVGLAGSPDVPELVTFAGYVGPVVTQQSKEWCVFYLDTRLLTWLLVPVDGIVYRDPVVDDKAPCGIQDVLWVKADTSVGHGSGSLTLEGQFLTGEFTRAGDFEAAPTGGTLGAATGVFCEARSPGCCKPCTVRTYR
jgi:hypothetical protein